ncbi:MAG TPA: hypothetical protein VMW19_11010 [Myxococcota bacterium]|nr:hypothetical protein [Myxococcota bacterium]
MFEDFTPFLWLLKLGALVNLYFLSNTFSAPARGSRAQQHEIASLTKRLARIETQVGDAPK